MTTIVAVRTGEHVVIGSDSMLTQGETRVTHAHCVTSKLYTVADSCIGLSGTAAHYTSLIRALREMGEACELHGYDAVFDTFTRVHKKLKDEYFLNPKRQADDAYEANHISAMVAISPGALKDEDKRALPGTDLTYYRVTIRTEGNTLTKAGSLQLNIIPGMTGTVDILTGKKSVFDYLLKPMLRVQEAFREP